MDVLKLHIEQKFFLWLNRVVNWIIEKSFKSGNLKNDTFIKHFYFNLKHECIVTNLLMKELGISFDYGPTNQMSVLFFLHKEHP